MKKGEIQQMIHSLAVQNTSKVNKPVYMSPTNSSGGEGKHTVQWQQTPNNNNFLAGGGVGGGEYGPLSHNVSLNNKISFKNIQSSTPIDGDLIE
jgi:hypothetical protein